MAASQVRKVLIVTASTGAGHNSVAESLRQTFRDALSDRVEIAVVDLLNQSGCGWLSPAGRLYSPIIVRHPALWGPIFNASNNQRFWRLFRKSIKLKWTTRILRRLAAEKPDVVVCVHPVCVQILVEGLRQMRNSAPLVTVLTDLVDVHKAWVASEVDLYVAPTEETSQRLFRSGVESERIKLFGLPLNRRFLRMDHSFSHARLHMGLKPNLFTILVSGGGEGAGDILGTVKAVARSGLPVQLIVACGRNEILFRSLKQASLGVLCYVTPFCENMPEITAAADVVIGKAGALTIGEALLARKPIIIHRPLPGQEQGNAEFVRRHKVGIVSPDFPTLVYTIGEWIAKPGEVAAIVANGESWREEWSLAATRTVEATLELLGEREMVRC